MLLDPLGRSCSIFLLEGGVEDGLAFEARALRDAFDGGIQVRACPQEGDGMGHTQFIPIGREGGIQLLVKAVGDTDTGDIECLREVMQGKADFDIGLFGFDIGHDALQIR